MTCSWRWFIHPETAISKKRNGSSTLCVFKTHYRDRRATVANHLIFMQIQFSDHMGYDRIVGALANLGYTVSEETVRECSEAPRDCASAEAEPNHDWKEFIQSHMAVLAGIDFFTVEVLTWRGLVPYYVLFFIHPESRVSA